MRKFKSPIELAFRNALVSYVDECDAADLEITDFSTGEGSACLSVQNGQKILACPDWNIEDGYLNWGEGTTHLYLYADVIIGTYRVDFLIETTHQAFLAIECDGHEWHDRTKQQASSDRARDRALLAMGIPTIRFTGSDLFHNAHACAVEAASIAAQLQNQLADIEADAIDKFMSGHSKGLEQGLEDARAEAALDKATERFRGVFRGLMAELG